MEDLARATAAVNRALRERDENTSAHSGRTCGLALETGQACGLSAEDMATLKLAAELHDVGKIGIPDRVLLKPGLLDGEEVSVVRTHPLIGDRLLEPLDLLAAARPIVRHHHERWDGSGYPDGLKGEAIPLGARLMAVVDVFDALHTARPYKAALSTAEALATLKAEAEAGAWEPRVVACFAEIVRDVSLRNGRVAVERLEQGT